MVNQILQLVLVITTVLFFIYILLMIKNKKLELKYSLVWLCSSFLLIIFSIFPSIIKAISTILHIETPVNALFLMIIFFLIIISFTLTIALSRNSNRVKVLTQELAILKNEFEHECVNK